MSEPHALGPTGLPGAFIGDRGVPDRREYETRPATPERHRPRPLRQHTARELDKIAYLHEQTPADALTSNGIQARAWSLLRELVALRLGEQAPEAVVADLIAFYCATFDLRPAEVAEDLNEWLPQAAPRIPRVEP